MYCSCYEIYHTNNHTDHQRNVVALTQFCKKLFENESNTTQTQMRSRYGYVYVQNYMNKEIRL